MLPAATNPVVVRSATVHGPHATRPTPPSDMNLTPLEGVLSKYTNVMKGWQNRYFILNPHQGILEYHVNQSEALSSSHKPRGTLHLAGAMISPSTEDSFTFTVNPAFGDAFKLRAVDARERHHWVSHLNLVVKHFTQQIAQEHPPILQQSLRKPRSTSNPMSNIAHKVKDAADQVHQKTANVIAKTRANQVAKESAEDTKESSKVTLRQRTNSQKSSNRYSHTNGVKRSNKSDCKELRDAREILVSADNYHAGLMNMLEGLPLSAPTDAATKDYKPLSAIDEEVLLLKSTSAATLKCLDECYNILQQYQQRQFAALPPGAQISWVQPRDSPRVSSPQKGNGDATLSISNQSAESFDNFHNQEPVINPADEVCDEKAHDESDLGTVEKHKSVIMHLLSQLKLGMDLTRVTLPTFILEKRSLLEMYSDFIAHAELFIAIPGGSTPKERMIRVLKYYLTSFHCGRKGQVAKKPYNPIVGETFQCSYYVPKSIELGNQFQQKTVPDDMPPSAPDGKTHYRIRYAAEQVSHHPPVSAFYAECPEREICMNSHIWTKSKFMNMSIGVVNIGEGVINLTGYKEKYVLTFPSAFARSILTTPWMELGGRCTITCDQTNLTANIAFHTKPMYAGNPHRITADVKDSVSGSVFCHAEGVWNGDISITSTTPDGITTTETIDTTSYKGYKKYVRPLNMQEPMESRNLWKGITASLLDNDIATATDRKTALEDWQRRKEKQRLDSSQSVQTILFQKNGDAYIYKNSLITA